MVKDPTSKPITDIQWHTAPITSIQFQPREECVLAVSSDDGKLTLWDFSVEPDSNEPTDVEVPPQLMFLHQGQQNIKELRFHPQYDCTLVTTAEDSFNVFRPNLDPEEQPDEDDGEMSDTRQKTKDLQKMVDEY